MLEYNKVLYKTLMKGINMSKGKKALELFNNGYNCSQAIVLAFKDELNIDETTLKAMSSSFGGGISRLREVCGCISSMALILGAIYGNYDINSVEAKGNHYKLVQNVALKFKEKFNSINCAELLNKQKGIESPIPSVRNNEYYKQRPCGKYIEFMADLIEKEIASNGKD